MTQRNILAQPTKTPGNDALNLTTPTPAPISIKDKFFALYKTSGYEGRIKLIPSFDEDEIQELYAFYLNELDDAIKKKLEAVNHPAHVLGRGMYDKIKFTWEHKRGLFTDAGMFLLLHNTIDLVKAPANSSEFTESSDRFMGSMANVRQSGKDCKWWGNACAFVTVLALAAVAALAALTFGPGVLSVFTFVISAVGTATLATIPVSGMFKMFPPAYHLLALANNMEALDTKLHEQPKTTSLQKQ